MNILLSHNWLKEYVDIKKTPQELANKLSLHSMAVEKVMPEVALLTDDVVVGEILKIKPHPNADKLQLATVTDGEKEYPVVCGASNIAEGMKIAFAKPGAMVRWHGEGDPVELEPAKIRGEYSEGMICDNAEIGLADKPDPKGIADYSHLKAKPGTPLAKALKFDDTIFDIEITTNRVDAACVVGMAREVAAMTGERLTPPSVPPLGRGGKNSRDVRVSIEDKESCNGFHAVALDGIKIASSPDWMQRRLRAAGFEPVNNVVDVTNYVMHELGHPLHAFDYDKVADGGLVVRKAKKGEKLVTLDGKEEKLDNTMPVVADGKRALAIGGIMGGEESAISDETTTVLLEAASWNNQIIRQTAMKLDKFTDASSYFVKGVSPQLAKDAFERAAQLLKDIAGAEVASEHIAKGYKYRPKSVSMDMKRAEELIGEKLKNADVKKQLTALGFDVKTKGGKITASVPHWRQDDVTIEEDLIEEVARMHGYQNIENELPGGQMPVPEFDKHIEFEKKLKHLMQACGYTELYTYSMVSEELLAYSREKDKAISLMNPLDDEHAYMRTDLMPSMLEVAARNQGIAPTQRLFEIANNYPQEKKNALPNERLQMGGVLVGEDHEMLFREAKGVVLRIMKELGLEQAMKWEKLSAASGYASNGLAVTIDGKEYGVLSQLSVNAGRAFGVKKPTILFRLDIHELIELAYPKVTYQPLPKYPAIELDLSVLVPASTEWGQVESIVREEGGNLLEVIRLFDIYELSEEEKSFGFHLAFRSEEKTLEMEEVEKLQKKIVNALKKLNARLR